MSGEIKSNRSGTDALPGGKSVTRNAYSPGGSGRVFAADIRSGSTSAGHTQIVEYGLKLGSNPEFTASVLVAYARAVHRLHQRGDYGAKTVFDVAPGLLSPQSAEQLRAELL